MANPAWISEALVHERGIAMMRQKYDDTFVEQEAHYLILKFASYSQVAQEFNVPLSTVGWHMKYRLQKLNPALHSQVMSVVGLHYRFRKEIWDALHIEQK